MENTLPQGLTEMNQPNGDEFCFNMFQNDVCVVYFKIGNQLGISRTRKELYEEASRINVKYNQHGH